MAYYSFSASPLASGVSVSFSVASPDSVVSSAFVASALASAGAPFSSETVSSAGSSSLSGVFCFLASPPSSLFSTARFSPDDGASVSSFSSSGLSAGDVLGASFVSGAGDGVSAAGVSVAGASGALSTGATVVAVSWGVSFTI